LVCSLEVIGDGFDYGLGKLSDWNRPLDFSTIASVRICFRTVIYKFSRISKVILVENEIANICMTQCNFGLTVDALTREWNIIVNFQFIDFPCSFNLSGIWNNMEDLGLDSGWLIAFIWTGKNYKVRYRTLNYIFESNKETSLDHKSL
jgi:hypothetical protein